MEVTVPRGSERIDPIEIGRRIAQARAESLGVTQRELAELLGVSLQAVQQWERGARSPVRQLNRLARALGVSRGWLLWGDTDEPAAHGLKKRVAANEEAIGELTRAVDMLVAALSRDGVDVSAVREALPTTADIPAGPSIDVVTGEPAPPREARSAPNGV
jgi:transcriptional regulator with XRE-family HTH domain